MITLYRGMPGYGLPGISPFSLKLELFLRAAGIDYRLSTTMGKPPKRKIPFIEYRGETLGDSTLIINRLMKDFSVTMDDHLSDTDKAQGYLTCRALEEGYYFCDFYANWIVKENWIPYRDTLLANVPLWIRVPGGGYFRRRFKKTLYLQGTSRHSYAEIQRFGEQYLQAVETLIGDKDYLFGDKFTSFDCTVYGFVTRGLRVPTNSGMHRFIQSSAILKDYCRRIDSRYEMAKSL